MPTTLAMRTAPTVTVCLLLWPRGCSAERAASQVTDDDARVASLVVQPIGALGAQSTANRENGAPRGTWRIERSQLVYRGAFRLPDGSNESNWEYSGYAMTFYPAGDPEGPDDGYPGSLFAVGHDHQQHVSEIAIPLTGHLEGQESGGSEHRPHATTVSRHPRRFLWRVGDSVVPHWEYRRR